MAHKILKSLMPTEEAVNAFQRLCNKQIDEMRAYDLQMKMVAKDPKTYHPYQPPSAHPDVMASIVQEGNDYNVEFEIVDDVTPLPPTLDEKKAASVAKLHEAAQAVHQPFLIPPLKRRAHMIDFQAAIIVPKEKRTAEQNKLVDDGNATSRRLEAANAILAKAESEIHDLTEKTIDKWKLPDFSGVK